MAYKSRARPSLTRSVLLGMNPGDPYHRDMIEGVLQYVRQHATWELLLAPGTDAIAAHLRDANPTDGLIATQSWHGKLPGDVPGVPTVVTIARGPLASYSVVTDDESSIAKMALSHFREIGLTRFAFLDHLAPPSDRRLAFAAEVSKAGMECHAYPPVGYRVLENWHERTEAIADWVENLPKPLGIFCFHATEAQQLAMACNRRGLHVPEQVAILSCGGDDIECHLASPPISAIDQGGDRLGYEAARRLDELMDGKNPAPTFTRFDPVGVTRRQSTDLMAVEDPHIATAVQLIHEQACDGLTVRELTRHIPLSRRRLDYAFERTLGRSMHQQIMHERLERAKKLLIRTNLSLTEVAGRAGFNYPTRLSEAFRREFGMTPTEFRKQNQSVAVGA